MNDTEKKLQVLSAIAHVLNAHRITWAVGASLLLYLKGKTDSFHDIDLMVLEEDVDELKEALCPLGAMTQPPSTPQYRTRHFLNFLIDGVEVDVLAGFVIVCDGVAHDCSLRPDQVCEYTQVNGETIPLQALSDWKRYYRLMGRPEKVKMIEQ